MAKRKQYVSEEQTNKALVALTEMAKKPKCLTLQQAIEKMRPKILLALQQGYTQQDVAELLKTIDIQISLVTLRQYLKAGNDTATARTEPAMETIAQPLQTLPTVPPLVDERTPPNSDIDQGLAGVSGERSGKAEVDRQLVAQTIPKAKPQAAKAMLPITAKNADKSNA